MICTYLILPHSSLWHPTCSRAPSPTERIVRWAPQILNFSILIETDISTFTVSTPSTIYLLLVLIHPSSFLFSPLRPGPPPEIMRVTYPRKLVTRRGHRRWGLSRDVGVTNPWLKAPFILMYYRSLMWSATWFPGDGTTMGTLIPCAAMFFT